MPPICNICHLLMTDMKTCCVLSAFAVLRRCRRCLALLYSHNLQDECDVEFQVCSQRLQHLCLPLLEAAQSPLHLLPPRQPEGGEREGAVGTFQLVLSPTDE